MEEQFNSCMRALFWVGLFQDIDDNLFPFVSVKPSSLASTHSFHEFFSLVSHSTQHICVFQVQESFIFPAKKHSELIYLHYLHWSLFPFTPDTAHSSKHFQSLFWQTKFYLSQPYNLNKHLLIFNINKIFVINKIHLCFPAHFGRRVCPRKLGIYGGS